MELQELIDELNFRAKSTLLNEDEITLEIVTKASNEALVLIENKPLVAPMVVDLAYYRLCLLLKVEIDEGISNLAKEALKSAKELKIDDSGELTYNIKSGKRLSEELW